MNVLVTGGTGTVGSHVVRELRARGAQVQVLTRNPAKAGALPPGVTAVVGDLKEVETVRRIFKGVDGVFLLNSVSPTEVHEGLFSVCALRDEQVKRLVYVSVQDADKAPWLPHFGGKLGIEAAVRHTGTPATILRPNNFYQNDDYFKDALLQHGVYPQPLGRVGLNRVDVRDIAEAAAIALTTDGHAGQTYDVVGPAAYSGPATAEAWAQALRRPIAYGGDDLDAWEQQSLQYLPDWMVYDFRHMYAFFQEKGLKAAPGAIERVTALLGHPPRSFEAYAAEAAAAWTS